ncbi:peptide MFS transporter [candidate division KSB1 bacterium]|nr:peptide MFS transporter [candidate division KSB1 bacterium]
MFKDQPRGLPVLFFTEMWERFSYYGMRALLVLFMTAAVAEGGLGLEIAIATAIYGLYTFGVYAMAIPGGWIADKLIGQRRAVLIGGIIIALGHYTLALPMLWTFYLGLLLVIMGTGLLKPNVSAIVGELYPEGGARRDAGFSIFYMGINVGAVLGQSVCALLGEKVDWHLGFGAAAIGMTFGIIQYVAGKKHLQNVGELKGDYAKESSIKAAKKQFIIGIGIVLALIVAFVLYLQTTTSFDIVSFAENIGLSITAIAFIYFTLIIIFVCKNSNEKKRVGLIWILFLGAALFWSGFEQAGSSMNLFARDFTDRMAFGWEVPTGWLQSINPIFIVILAPVMGMLWVRLGDKNPNIPIKFGIGLVLLGVGFFVIAWGASFIEAGKVSPMWLVVTYFFHTVGELCLSPVGLSSITKLSPDRLVGQMMGTWFMGAALGNLIAGLVAGYIEKLPQNELYAVVAAIVMVSGFMFLLLQKPINKLSCGIK